MTGSNAGACLFMSLACVVTGEAKVLSSFFKEGLAADHGFVINLQLHDFESHYLDC